MKHIKTTLHLIFAVIAAAFLAACSDMQTGSGDSSYSDYGGGHSGHGGHH